MVKINLNGIRAAIFDIDGTMVANQEYHKKSWIVTLEKYGLLVDDAFYRTKISGGKNEIILKKIFPGIGPDEIKRIAKEKEYSYQRLYKNKVIEVRGLTTLVKKLRQKGLKLAIATSAPFLNRDFVLEALNLKNYFGIIVGGEDIKSAKPDPEIYLKTVNKLRVKPEECLVFEDSPSGVAAAKAADMKIVVGVLTYHLAEDIKLADFVIKDFTEIEFD